MSCFECDRARVDRLWFVYRRDCPSCTARSIARSPVAHAALSSSDADRDPLREVVARLLHAEPTAEARKMVGDWWRFDRASTE